MDNFNMKQWLQENKVGPYSKTLLREGMDDERDFDPEVEGKPSSAFQRFVSQKRGEEAAAAQAAETHKGLKRGDKVKVDSDAAKELKVKPDDVFTISSFRIFRPGTLLQNINVVLKNDAGKEVGSVNIESVHGVGSHSGMEETVGYAMITKPAVEEAYTGPIPDTESIVSYVRDIALSNISVENIPETSIRDLISNLQTKFEEGNIKTYEELKAEIERMVGDEEIKSSLTPGPDSKFVGEPTSDLFKMYTKS